MCIYIYIYIYITRLGPRPALREDEVVGRGDGMIRLETLVELEFLNSSFSSSDFSIRAFRAYPLFELRQQVPGRAIRGKSSDPRQHYLSQQYPPPLLRLGESVAVAGEGA